MKLKQRQLDIIEESIREFRQANLRHSFGSAVLYFKKARYACFFSFSL